MNSFEIQKYEAAHAHLIGQSSPVPLPFFYEEGRKINGLWHVPIDIEVNVVSIVMGDWELGWTPIKAEPFTKQLWLNMDIGRSGKWRASTYKVKAFDGPLPHINRYTCFTGKILQAEVEKRDDLAQFGPYLSMICAEVNLGSLLAWWTAWDTRIFRFFPPNLLGAMKKHWSDGTVTYGNMNDFKRSADVSDKEFKNLTWSTL